jgi:N-acetyl-anhydromuramyl-L-alanine amidase AmpD
MNIKQVAFSDYYKEITAKKQIYLHHTAGTGIAENVFGNWERDKQGRIGTCVAIGRDGTIAQGFKSEFWAYHLGLTSQPFRANNLPFIPLDKISIGIEIVNWGFLTKKGDKYLTYVNSEVHKDEVCTLDKPYKGQKYWQNYTDEQIESVVELLKLWKTKYNIDISYKEDIWQVTPRALRGENGVFTHNSVRIDKCDVYPHPKLIEALKSL